jgi:hypothetical protein
MKEALVKSYSLERSRVEIGTPAEVGRQKGHFWFPTLHPVEGRDLLCVVTVAADVAQGQWPSALYLSRDGGGAWKRGREIPSYGHQSVRVGPRALLLLPYELWPLSPGDRRGLKADGTLLTCGEDGEVSAEATPVRYLDFPEDLADYHEGELMLLTNGNLLPLKDGRLFATVYGRFARDEAMALRVFAVTSGDGGFTWQYLSTVAGPEDVTDTPKAPRPSESNTVRLADGRLMCVYRVGSYLEYRKSYSRDEGKTWTRPERMDGAWSVEPQVLHLENGLILLSGGRLGLFLWVCADGEGKTWERINLAEHHNATVADSNVRFSDAFCEAEASFDPYQSTSYTGMVAAGPDEALICYDRLANGWEGAPGPWGAEDAVFCIRVRATR